MLGKYIDAEEVTLNEEFSVLIKHKVEEIILHLMEESFREGIQQSVLENHKVELYKLILYEKGGHFVAHRTLSKPLECLQHL